MLQHASSFIRQRLGLTQEKWLKENFSARDFKLREESGKSSNAKLLPAKGGCSEDRSLPPASTNCGTRATNHGLVQLMKKLRRQNFFPRAGICGIPRVFAGDHSIILGREGVINFAPCNCARDKFWKEEGESFLFYSVLPYLKCWK